MVYVVNYNVLSQRYATKALNDLFSEEGKTLLEREFWVTVLKAQKKLGMKIPEGVVEKYEESKENIDLELIKRIELKTKHDVKAKIEAFNIAAGGVEYVHLGMTSRDLTDNVEQLQIKRAAELVFGKYVSVLRHFVEKAEEYKHIEITGRTHHQAAQTTLLGRRFAMWAEELHIHLTAFEKFIHNYPFRGMKGPVGTQFDMLNLLGSVKKVDELEKDIAEQLGFSNTLNSPGQVYPRSLDYSLVYHLAALASACENFGKTMRLMAGYELVTEGFEKGQVGSSILPHKMNTRSSERICALAELLKMYCDGASRLAGDQWEEGDISCSALRRVIIPDSFYTTDGLIETTLTVLNNMGPYPAVIHRELDRYLPFLATTEILAIAIHHGLGREKAHETIKKHAVSEAIKMRETGSSENNLVKLLTNDPVFKKAGIKPSELKEIFQTKKHFIGNAHHQIEAIKKKTNSILQKHPHYAEYEPGEIL